MFTKFLFTQTLMCFYDGICSLPLHQLSRTCVLSLVCYIFVIFFFSTGDVSNLFSTYGTVVECKLVANSSALPTGIAVVKFSSLESAKAAVDNLNSKQLDPAQPPLLGEPLVTEYSLFVCLFVCLSLCGF
jgi:hypothetical protein